MAVNYLDFQASVGITKHNGGFPATNELLRLCHIQQARTVLNVGCGIGVGSTHIARAFGCQVIGVDISPQMIAWSRLRAREEGVAGKASFQVADVLNLSFATDCFDVVFAESVLAFVADKRRALGECVRVARPGGYVGLNETFWLGEAPPELAARARASLTLGAEIPTAATWQALWAESGLQERVVRTYPIDARAEVRDRIQWVGWRWAVRASGRLLQLYLTQPAARQSIRQMFDAPLAWMQQMGYGLFVGRK